LSTFYIYIYIYTYIVADSTTVLSVVRQLIKSTHRWEDNIKMDLQEMGCGARDWIELAQDTNR
jgi:hypothetical protein